MTTPRSTFGDLAGRTALVTGAGSPGGIGFASARLLGGLGARLVIAATSDRIHERVEELRDMGIDAVGAIGDLTTDDGVRTVVGAAAAGTIDILVNNAGMVSTTDGGESGSLAETDIPTWHRSLERNLTSAYRVTRAVLPAMVERHWGRVVMVSSVTGPVVAYPGDVAYAAAKAGMTGLMRALAVEVGGHGVTVNAVAPGWIDTPSATDDERRMGRATPVGRPGTADETAAAVVFCCLPEASYVTGQVIVVDGGNIVQDDKRLVVD